MDDIVIKIDNVSKEFKLPHEKNSSIKSVAVNFYKREKGYELQKALENVSLEIKKGEFFGIVGRNGSGKSTLLKLLAGIYMPTKGSIQVNGTLTPFIELGVGFNPELTGRENVYLNGALLGFSRKEMGRMYKDIVEFAELEKFMDQKLKNYSSGMQVRLAFSIAIRAQSDILLIDEVLAVGDTAFQKKCFDYFEEIKTKGTTVILVTHDMDAVTHFCNRAALISYGKLKFAGDPGQVAELYEEQNASDQRLSEAETVMTHGVEIKELSIKNYKKDGFEADDSLTVNFKVRSKEAVKIRMGINLTRADGQFIAGLTSQFQIKPQLIEPGKEKIYEFDFNANQLTPGIYLIDGVVYDEENSLPIFFKPAMAEFEVLPSESGWGALNLQGQWKDVFFKK